MDQSGSIIAESSAAVLGGTDSAMGWLMRLKLLGNVEGGVHIRAGSTG